MSPIALRMLIRVATILGFLLLIVLWRSIRSRNKCVRYSALALIVAVSSVFLLNEFGGKYFDKIRGPDPEFQKKLDATARFVDANRARIAAAAQKLDALRTLVSRDDWLSAGERTADAEIDSALLFWAEQLRGEELASFDVPESDLWDLESLIEFAADPQSIYVIPASDLESLLKRTEAPCVIIGQLDAVTRSDASAGTPGRVNFAIAVVQLDQTRIVAHGCGQATNTPSLRLTAPSYILSEDLWQQTCTAARALAERLVQTQP